LEAAFDQQEIAEVVERVRLRLRGHAEAPPPAPVDAEVAAGDGIYPDVDAAVAAARRGFEAYRSMGLKKRHRIIDAVRAAMREHVAELSRMAHEETGIGRAEDKLLKNRLVIEKTPGPEDLEPQVWSGDQGLTVTEYAPFGVIGAITPTTNPTAAQVIRTRNSFRCSRIDRPSGAGCSDITQDPLAPQWHLVRQMALVTGALAGGAVMTSGNVTGSAKLTWSRVTYPSPTHSLNIKVSV